MEEDKLPLKRVELSLSKFNEVAIPHHLDLLRQHKANIIKYETIGEWERVRMEQAHARRVASQLRGLLGELDALRRRVRDSDVPSFDKATQHSRDLTLRAVMDYLGVIERSCLALVQAGRTRDTEPVSIERNQERTVAGSAISTDSVGVVAHVINDHDSDRGERDDHERTLGPDVAQLQIHDKEVMLQQHEATLRGWRELQAEVRALHDTWQSVQAAALSQREQISAIGGNVETAADNVQDGRTQLAWAERMKIGALGASGALAGALVGGPIGLVIGVKAAAAAVLAGSAIGYITGRAIGQRRALQITYDVDAHDDTGSEDANGHDRATPTHQSATPTHESASGTHESARGTDVENKKDR